MFSPKFDKIMQVAVSPGYLHFKPVCCTIGMQPLAIPWDNIQDNSMVSNCCGGVGQLLLVKEGIIVSFDGAIYQQCIQHKSATTAVPVGASIPVVTGAFVQADAQPMVVVTAHQVGAIACTRTA
jgi:methyl coenzyme M reductase subunit C